MDKWRHKKSQVNKIFAQKLIKYLYTKRNYCDERIPQSPKVDLRSAKTALRKWQVRPVLKEETLGQGNAGNHFSKPRADQGNCFEKESGSSSNE